MTKTGTDQRTSSNALTWVVRLLLVAGVLFGCGLAAYVLLQQVGGLSTILGRSDNPALEPIEEAYLRAYLNNNQLALSEPAGAGTLPVSFTISPGSSANQIATELEAVQLLNNRELFLNYIRYNGIDAQLEAGDYVLSPQMTVPELAWALTDAVAQEETVRFIEGWRIEEMADYLRENPTAQIDPEAFLALAQRQRSLPNSYDFLGSLPPTVPLEGYLFPDTYRLPLDADAAFLIDLMLTNFGTRVSPAMRQAFGANGLTLHEAVTLASIVEREAVIPAERPLIAGVFFNRLGADIKLEADPTVQYPLGYQPDLASWWKRPLTVADLENPSPYNTYVFPGLPPTPIANPGLSSLEAVAYPAQSDFIFFIADCDGAPGSHLFSVNYEEHLAKFEACQ